MATHSGFTRWQDFHFDEKVKEETENFGAKYPRAIDEIWYKRAVEQHYVHAESFVFSVPIIQDKKSVPFFTEFFNNKKESVDNSTLVTASRAVFVGT